MIKVKDSLSFALISINIIFLLYYSIQLLVFTNEFALKNIGFFNHAVAGLSEIIGIIFLCLSVGLLVSFFKGIKIYSKSFRILICIFYESCMTFLYVKIYISPIIRIKSIYMFFKFFITPTTKFIF